MFHILIRYYAAGTRVFETTLNHAFESEFPHNVFIARIFRL